MVYGNKPTDDGNFILTESQKEELICADKNIEKYICKYIGSTEFITISCYCIWLDDKDFTWRKINEINKRVQSVQNFRLKSSAKPTRDKAETPYLFLCFTAKKFILTCTKSFLEKKKIYTYWIYAS